MCCILNGPGTYLLYLTGLQHRTVRLQLQWVVWAGHGWHLRALLHASGFVDNNWWLIITAPHLLLIRLLGHTAHHEHVADKVWTIVQVIEGCDARCWSLCFIIVLTECKDVADTFCSTALILRIASLVVVISYIIDYVASEMWMLLWRTLKSRALSLPNCICIGGGVEASRPSTILQACTRCVTMMRWKHDTLTVVSNLWCSRGWRIEVKEAVTSPALLIS